MRLNRLVTGFALVLGLTAATGVLGAGQAVATRSACVGYLGVRGYSGLLVGIGCDYGERHQTALCEGTLRVVDGPPPEDVVVEACRRAGLSR